jgi:hypothetical protein
MLELGRTSTEAKEHQEDGPVLKLGRTSTEAQEHQEDLVADMARVLAQPVEEGAAWTGPQRETFTFLAELQKTLSLDGLALVLAAYAQANTYGCQTQSSDQTSGRREALVFDGSFPVAEDDAIRLIEEGNVSRASDQLLAQVTQLLFEQAGHTVFMLELVLYIHDACISQSLSC